MATPFLLLRTLENAFVREDYCQHMLKLMTALLLSTIAFSTSDTAIKGVVTDASGAAVQNARIQVLDQSGKVVAEAISGQDGGFEFSSSSGHVTVVVIARNFDKYTRELTITEGTVTDLKAELTVGCTGDIAQVIPKKLDLKRFLLEIHYWGSFGDCPEKIYRLWGTGEASISYFACDGKTYSASKMIDPSVLETALANIAREQNGPACNYYPGGLDAPRVELSIISGSEPRLLIGYDAADEPENVAPLERKLEKLIDPENRMQTFREQSRRTSNH